MFGHININSIRNKFEMLSNSIKCNLDMLMISETKLNSTFSSNEFTIEKGMRLQKDSTKTVEEEDSQTRSLTTSLPKDFEGFFV